MPEEITIVPEPTGKEPLSVQSAMVAIREEQLALGEQGKTHLLRASLRVAEWVNKVASGDEPVTQYSSKGEVYTVDGPQFLYESANQLKSLASAIDLAMGEQESRKTGISVAILNRTSAAPIRLNTDNGDVIEIVELD